MDRVDHVFCTDSRTESPMRLSFPSCEELGIPMNTVGDMDGVVLPGRVMRNLGINLHHPKYPTKKDPFSPYCMIPLPSPFGLDPDMGPAFIRKRNERERERVRCVNDGYSRLKQHVPIDNKEKRISKVEILRSAIDYIRHLQTLLDEDNHESESEIDRSHRKKRDLKRPFTSPTEREDEEAKEIPSNATNPPRKVKRIR